MSGLRPSRRKYFENKTIFDLPLEYDAVLFVFGEFWDEDGDVCVRATEDYNHYTTSRSGKYNVVLTLFSYMGKAQMAGAAASVCSSYTGLMASFARRDLRWRF